MRPEWTKVVADHDSPEGRRGLAYRTTEGRRVMLPDARPAGDLSGWIAAMEAPGVEARVLVDGNAIIGAAEWNPRVHAITDRLLEAFGADVEAAHRWALGPHLWVSTPDAWALGDVPPGPAVATMTHGLLEMSTLDRDLMLTGGCVVVPHGVLPATALAVAKGRPLRDIVSHPVLNLVDATVLQVAEIPAGVMLRIVPVEGAVPIASDPAS